MRSTMQDVPLEVRRILEHGAAFHSTAQVITAGPGGGLRSARHGGGGPSAEHPAGRVDIQGRFPAMVQPRLVGPGGEVLPHDGHSVGELEVREPWITGSYYTDDDPEKFRAGWLRTGDIGAITPDGYLTLTDTGVAGTSSRTRSSSPEPVTAPAVSGVSAVRQRIENVGVNKDHG